MIRNDAGVQLLSPFMHRQVFGDGIHPPLDQRAVSIAKAHLAVNGLAVKESPVISAKDFILPPLLGESIEQHFDKLGYITSEPYLGLANELAEVKLPPKPDTWQKVSGWTRYDADGSFEFVRYPEEDAIVFDVETLYKLSPYAVMAAAVSEKHWYSWVSPWLLGESEDALHLIPMHSEQTTLIVGHNVGYDRARIDGEYDLQGSKNRFLDTMSLHCAVKGLTSHQRAPWMKHRKNQRLAAEAGGSEGASESAAARISRWEDHSSMNSLADVAELHCGIKVDKTARDWFSSLDKADIVTQFQDLMSYCAGDVDVTHRVFRKVFPAFRRACPSPVSFSGILQMGSSFLPVDVSWEKFIGNADRMYSDLTAKVESELHQLAEQARRSMFDMDADNPGHYRHETDPWLSQLDWTPKKARGLSRGKAKSIDLSKVPSAEFNAEADVSADVEDQQSAKPSHDDLAIGTPVEGASGNEVSDAVLASQHPSEPDSDQLSRAAAADAQVSTTHLDNAKDVKPDWYTHTFADEGSAITRYALESVLPYLLRLEMHGYPVAYLEEYGWCARVPKKEGKSASAKFAERVGTEAGVKKYQYFRLGKVSRRSLFNASALKAFEKGVIISPHAEIYRSLASVLSTRATVPATVTLEHAVLQQLRDIADGAVADAANASVIGNPWMSALDWTVTQSPQEEIQEESASSHAENEGAAESTPSDTGSETSGDRTDVIWPQWYWDMAKPRPNETGLNLSIRSRAAPLLLRLQWENHVLFHSRQFGWVYRKQKRQDTDPENTDEASLQPVRFSHAADDKLANDKEHDYYKLPHKDGAEANVGSPLSKTFIPAFEEGILSSEFAAAKAALSMNAQCSYWISARERVINQLVIWQDPQHQRGFPPPDARVERYGMILPQVVTMGTVTRRAVESTWLAASNAKKNRLGSELKAMVRAPEGYAIVGADVDSEELWICCVMGDAQFGLHGATAVGWMTLEGTKSAGTDLHSKTASILGITRDMAKVFNYSRIYGAGVKHAVQLLMQSNPKLSKADATDQANRLYAATKGLRDFKAAKSATGFARANGKFWYGGTESHVFNTLEEIAMAKRPRTPALGCGITAALAKENLPATEKSRAGEDFMPSRINWVVQSSGVDYLHMLIASMKYLTDTVSA